MADNTDGPHAHEAQQSGDQNADAESSSPVVEAEYLALTRNEKARALKVTDAECMAFYKMVVWIATSFLAGTLAFIEKIVPNPVKGSHWLLGGGWLLLIGSIFAIVLVRRLNIEAGTYYVRGDYDRSDAAQAKGRKLSDAAGFLLGGGMLGVMVFGFVNFMFSSNAGPVVQETIDGRPVSQGDSANRQGDVSVRAPGQHEPARHTASPSADRTVSSPPGAADSAAEPAPKEVSKP